MDLSQLNASNGNGEPVRAAVTALRAVGSTVLKVDSLTNWPTKFIATTGTLLSNGTLNPSTISVFSGHINGLDIAIDTYAPGYSDKGNSAGDIVIIKPTTAWADTVVASLKKFSVDANQGWAQLTDPITGLAVVPTIAYTGGRKEVQLTYASTDLTPVLTAGNKVKVARTAAPATRSATFVAASSQYASKASPTGSWPSTQFTLEAMVKPNSYYGTQGIVGRFSTNGFFMSITGSGYVRVYTAGTGGADEYNTTTTVPLGQFTHVSAVMNVTTNTCQVYFDGHAQPMVNIATACTAITNAGNVEVGSYAQAANFFDGQIADVRIWNVARTQAQIRDGMSSPLVGNETGLVAAWKLDGDFTDILGVNNLTSSGGAVATTLDSPFSANEWGVVTKVAKVGSDTVATVFAGRSYIPVTGISGTSYSTVASPYGFPSNSDYWALIYMWAQTSGTSPSGTSAWKQFPNSLASWKVPTGKWKSSFGAILTCSTNGGAAADMGYYATISPVTPTGNVQGDYADSYGNPSTLFINNLSMSNIDITLTTPTDVYLYTYISRWAVNNYFTYFERAPYWQKFECAYIN